jgi:hypothetical protein
MVPFAPGAYALKGRTPTTFPSSASFGHPLSPVLAPAREDPHANDVDRPRLTFHQCPAKGAGFPRTGMPSAVTLRPLSTRLLLPAVQRSASRPRCPTRFPQIGDKCLCGLCRRHAAVTRDARRSGERTPLGPPGLLVPGTDDPSTPERLGRRGRLRNRFVRSLPAPAAVP